MGKRRDANDVGRMPAASAFGVIGMNGAAADGLNRIFDEAGLVDGVCVNSNLDVKLVSSAQASVDSSGRAAPVFVTTSIRKLQRGSVRPKARQLTYCPCPGNRSS